jgi:UDP-N-acetylmuramate dehydrogenase
MIIRESVPLASHTSYKIGGPARYFALPETLQDVYEAISFCKERAISCCVLGKGTNVLVSDAGYTGLIISTENLRGMSFTDEYAEVRSGVLLNTFIGSAVTHGFGGLEKLSGIPGSVGGGIIMNAGAFGSTISDYLHSVQWIDLTSQTFFDTPAADLSFSYRSSSLKKPAVMVFSARFHLPRKNRAGMEQEMAETLARRKTKQPLEYPSCGSVFKRPPGNYAGALIEQAGLKGASAGGALVSPQHGNFIVNKTRTASAQDVFSLINRCRKDVYYSSGIELELEVLFLGDFKTRLWRP